GARAFPFDIVKASSYNHNCNNEQEVRSGSSSLLPGLHVLARVSGNFERLRPTITVQSTDLTLRLPACIVTLTALFAGVPAAMSGQTQYRVTRSADFQDESGSKGKVIATLPEGAEVIGSAVRNGWVQIELIGWVWGASVQKTDRKGFDLEVSASRGENLRQSQNGSVLAKLQEGFLLDQNARDDQWVR